MKARALREKEGGSTMISYRASLFASGIGASFSGSLRRAGPGSSCRFGGLGQGPNRAGEDAAGCPSNKCGLLGFLYFLLSSVGSLAMLLATRRASSIVNTFALSASALLPRP